MRNYGEMVHFKGDNSVKIVSLFLKKGSSLKKKNLGANSSLLEEISFLK